MTTKILFWISRDFLHFGIAKSMMEMYDIESYAIIEVNDTPRKFFKKQNIVNFKKVWYFDEEIKYSNIEPDMTYLKNIEKQYNLNLWLIAYAERQFLHYNQYYKFNSNEILSLLEQECKFFLNILDEIQPNFLVIRLTDFHNVDLISRLCASKGIKVLMLTPANLNKRWMVSESSKIDYLESQIPDAKIYFNDVDDMIEFWKKNNPINQTANYIKNNLQASVISRKNIMSLVKFFLPFNTDKDLNRFIFHGKSKIKIFRNALSMRIRKRIRSYYLNKISLKKILRNEKFVFFTLHVEPERSTLLLTPFYTNQLVLIRSLSKSLPVDYMLYVKEHPIMNTRNWRPISFYKEIDKLPNVRLLHPSIPNEEILPHCSVTVTISGTIGLEAAFFNKPSITFFDNTYSHLSFVSRVYDIKQLPEVIKRQLNTKINISELNDFYTILYRNSFYFDMTEFSTEKNPFHNSLLNNMPINDTNMNEFLQVYHDTFIHLASEHMKKIMIHKQHSSH